MCGIAGVWSLDASSAVLGARAMVSAQRHRGPDDEGVEAVHAPAGTLALGHRRLSILDLSPAGHQPMGHPPTGDWAVFNGEIYNFLELRAELEGLGSVFQSRCDTEVILHAFARWGTGAFDRLHGMFAIGMYDRRGGRLVLARDPLGIKPLYYAWGPSAFVFASEVGAAAASGLIDTSLDRRAVAGLLTYGAVPGPLTMLGSVKSLDPGTWAALDLTERGYKSRRLDGNRYWDFPEPREALRSGSEGASDGEIRSRLASAVKSHLISDVPVGVFLSSGIDSTALALLCAEARGGDVDTFTVGLAGEPGIDEGPRARRTAESLGTRHHEIGLTEAETRRDTERWLEDLDQPSVDGLNTYLISKAVRDAGIVVALSGLGGDELFGGYSTFREVPRLYRMARAARVVPRRVRAGLVGFLTRRAGTARRLKAAETAGTRASIVAQYFRRRRLFSDAEMADLGFDAEVLGLDENFLPPEAEPGRVVYPRDPIASVGVLESRFYMGNMLLRDSDANSMAHALEVRVPLLDRGLIDLAYALPGRSRVVRGGPNKPRLVAALPRRLPPGVLDQKKRGFSLPYARWMSGPLRERFESLVAVTGGSGLADPAGVRGVWDEFLAGGPSAHASWSRAWTLGTLGAWVSLSRSPGRARDGRGR